MKNEDPFYIKYESCNDIDDNGDPIGNKDFGYFDLFNISNFQKDSGGAKGFVFLETYSGGDVRVWHKREYIDNLYEFLEKGLTGDSFNFHFHYEKYLKKQKKYEK